MKLLTVSSRRTKHSNASQTKKPYWLLLALPPITASLVWVNPALAARNFLSMLATIGSADGQVLTPGGVFVDSSDNVFVIDQNDRVQKFNSSGVFQFKFATGGSSGGSFINPSGVTVNNTSGDIYVCDGWSERT